MHAENQTEKPGKGRVGKAGRLTRERVIDAGMEVVRNESLDGLTMKRVAETLGSSVMSLYHHVRDREDLVNGMVEQVAGELPDPPSDTNPVEELVAIFALFYRAFRRNPWVVRCLIEGHPGSARVEPLIERSLIAFERLGLEGAEAGHAYHAILHYTYGEVMVMDAFESGKHYFAPTMELRLPAMVRTMGAIEEGIPGPEPYYQNLRRILFGYRRHGERNS